MEVKVSRLREGVLLSGSLPAELSSAGSLEVYPLKGGLYLVCAKGALEKAAGHEGAGRELSGKEKEVVRKLLSVRFERRTPAEVGGLLSKEEKETLEGLMKRKLVHVFHGGKYEKEGVYNVSEFAFNAVREPVAASSAQQQSHLPASSPEHLEKAGWMVLESEPEARSFAAAYPDKVKSGAVMGIRAFDRKFYFVTRAYYEQWEKPLQAAVGKTERSAEEIAQALGMAPEGCHALLLHLCESGEIMEKRKGRFSKA